MAYCCRILIATYFFSALLIQHIESTSRARRQLIYSTNGSKLQLIFGTGVPIPLEHISATIGWVIKYTTPLPTNATQYTDPLSIIDGEKKRSISGEEIGRYKIYRSLERKLQRSHGNGRDCLMRTICEVARVPFKGTGLIGQVWNILLRPSSTRKESLLDDYHAAEFLGETGQFNCNAYYPNCLVDFSNFLTVVV